MVLLGALLGLTGGCESKADKYVRLTHEVATMDAQLALHRYQNDTLDAAIERARAANAPATAAKAQATKDSLFSRWIKLSAAREHAVAELAVLR
jgi:hypothetical protein